MPNTTTAGDSKKRLSILKTPKSRQAFQELDFDSSSHENSPDCLKKRRVSFAEKKHVKEFCDLKEQGTIWDNTYEESDQNVSHAIGTANEITNDIYQNIEFRENVNILVGETEYTTSAENNYGTNTENYVNPNCPISTTQIYNNSDADLEFTDMACVGHNRIYDSLELRQNIASLSHNSSTKTTEKTVLFDDSDGIMDFTDIANKLSEPNLEDETIIFTDSTIDTTPPVQSHLDLARNLDQDKENIYSKVPSNMLQHKVILPDCNDNKSYSEVVKCGNETILFNDFGCEMTEAIGTIRCRQSMDSQNLQIRSNRAGPNHKGNQSKLGNKTIFFDDVGCEITEAVSSLKSNMGHNLKSVESQVPEPNIPLCLPGKNPLTASLLDVEPMDVEPISSPIKKTPQKFTANFKNNDQTKIFHDSDMEFTTMVTNDKINYDVIRKNQMATKDQTIYFDNCDVEITGVVKTHPNGAKTESNTEEKELLQSTASASSEFCCNEPQRIVKKLPSENLERIDITEQFHKSITQDPISNIKGSDVSTNTEPNSIEFVNIGCQNSKKRKQDQMKDECTRKTYCSLLIYEISENAPTQNVIPDDLISSCDKSSELSRYCKHLKTTDPDESDSQFEKGCTIDNSTPLKDRRKTYVLSSNSSITKQSTIPTDVTVTNDCVSHLDDLQTVQECNKIIPPNPAPRFSAGQEISVIEQRIEEKNETAGEYNNDEPYYSFLGNVSDSDSDFTELTHIHEQQRTSQNQNNISLESRSELENTRDSNDGSCFTMFRQELEEHAKSCYCIWKIRSISKEKVQIDFISRSLVVIIHLEAMEALTIPQKIKDITIVSLLSAIAEENIRMVHRIILNKLDPKNLKQHYRTTRDILPLLEFITRRVKLQIDFMHEFERLQDLHHFMITGNEISFRLHSYKVQFAIKIVMDLKLFEDIGPNDISVQCILGSIRDKDIKQLITGVKKDHNFLTNYIKDVKEYIAVVVEKNFCF